MNKAYESRKYLTNKLYLNTLDMYILKVPKNWKIRKTNSKGAIELCTMFAHLSRDFPWVFDDCIGCHNQIKRKQKSVVRIVGQIYNSYKIEGHSNK